MGHLIGYLIIGVVFFLVTFLTVSLVFLGAIALNLLPGVTVKDFVNSFKFW